MAMSEFLEIEVSLLYGQLRDSTVYRDREEFFTGSILKTVRMYTNYASKGEQYFHGTNGKKKTYLPTERRIRFQESQPAVVSVAPTSSSHGTSGRIPLVP